MPMTYSGPIATSANLTRLNGLIPMKAASAPTLAEREAGRAAEQQWLRFARLYELMDEMFAFLGPAK